MNLILEKAGLHRKLPLGSAETWKLTEKGKPFAERLDVNKAHDKGVPVKQTKWHTSQLMN